MSLAPLPVPIANSNTNTNANTNTNTNNNNNKTLMLSQLLVDPEVYIVGPKRLQDYLQIILKCKRYSKKKLKGKK